MKERYSYWLLLTLILSAVFLSCQPSHPSPSVPIYTYPPQDNQLNTSPQPNIPVAPSPSANNPKEEYFERNVVVDERNNIFSIGIPPGYREKTEVTAQKLIDFWFEYLPAEVKLEVNGIEVQRSPFRWETRIKYTRSVTKFDYQITNTTGKDIAYYLHLIPSTTGESVAVVVRQRWIP